MVFLMYKLGVIGRREGARPILTLHLPPHVHATEDLTHYVKLTVLIARHDYRNIA